MCMMACELDREQVAELERKLSVPNYAKHGEIQCDLCGCCGNDHIDCIGEDFFPDENYDKQTPIGWARLHSETLQKWLRIESDKPMLLCSECVAINDPFDIA